MVDYLYGSLFESLPSSKWSLLNRKFMFLSGTADVRGYKQWKQVNGDVKKGAKATYILIPRIITRENDKGEDEEILAGFLARPVFRVEDTESEPLEYEQIELPDLKLIEKAMDCLYIIGTV